MNTTDLQKSPHGAGGFTLSLTKGKGNTRYSQAKKTAIIQAIQSSWTEEITAEDAAFLTFVGSANFKN